MKWKTTALLLVVTLGVGTYVSLYELKQPTPEQRQRLTKQILDVTPDTVTQLALDLPTAKVTVTRHGIDWYLAPHDVRANPDLIHNILSQLSPLQAERILSATSEHPLIPKEYGLDPAIGWMTLVANGSPTTLLWGETTPVQSNRYAKISNRPEIFVVATSVLDTANVPSEQFRDSRVIRFNAGDVTELAVTSPNATFTLTNNQNTWSLIHPLADRADRNQVTSLLNQLAGLAIIRFVDDAPQVEHLSQWGFDHAKAEITIRQIGWPKPVTLFFGNPMSDDATMIYVKRSDEPSLYAVPNTNVDSLLQNPSELRSKACFEFFTNNVAKVELAREGGSVTIEQTNGQWREAGSQTALDAQRVETLLNTLSDLRVVGFGEEAPSGLAQYGLDAPEGTISIWLTGSPDLQRVLVGHAIEGSTDRYGRIDGRQAIVRLPALINELLSTTSTALQPSAASEPQTAPTAPTLHTPTAAQQ